MLLPVCTVIGPLVPCFQVEATHSLARRETWMSLDFKQHSRHSLFCQHIHACLMASFARGRCLRLFALSYFLFLARRLVKAFSHLGHDRHETVPQRRQLLTLSCK
eukprot:s4357_g3.t1